MGKEVRDDLRYTKTHEWIQIQNNAVLIGITDHAQSELTDIVFVELPEVGKVINKDDELCVVESVKSVSEIYSPISGTVIEVNTKLNDSPELINESPYDEGWIVKLEIKDKSETTKLLDAQSYKKVL